MEQSFFLSLFFMCAAGCAGQNGSAPQVKGAHSLDGKEDIHSKLLSAHYFLGSNDVKGFRRGRSKTDTLEAVHWRGNFQMAGQYEGGSATVISYDLFSKGPGSAGGEVVFAIFVEDKFAKFVNWFPVEMEFVPYEGTTRSHPKPIEIGNIGWFIRAVESDSVDISELEKEMQARSDAPSQIDPGLTIAYLLLNSQRLTPALATEKDYQRNTQLRDQFNAARLTIGMTDTEVEAVFHSKPIASGKTKAGAFVVYGSDESFNIDPVLLYSNVLVVFKEGQVSLIYAIDGGSDWREKARSRFTDFAN